MNDTSDEAFKKWYDEEAVPTIQLLSTYTSAEFARAAWAEAVRCCEARMEEERRKAFEEGFEAHGCCLADPMGSSMESCYRAWKERAK